MAYQVKALTRLLMSEFSPWDCHGCRREWPHRLASDCLLWHTLTHLPQPSKAPKSENEYIASLHFKATQ